MMTYSKEKADVIIKALPGSVAMIAASTGLSLSSANRGVKHLVKINIIKVVGQHQMPGHRANIYGVGGETIPDKFKDFLMVDTPHKTRWVGGIHPCAIKHVFQGAT